MGSVTHRLDVVVGKASDLEVPHDRDLLQKPRLQDCERQMGLHGTVNHLLLHRSLSAHGIGKLDSGTKHMSAIKLGHVKRADGQGAGCPPC